MNKGFKNLPTKAPNTNRTQTMTQDSIAVSPSALGMLVVMELKMFTRISGGMRKLIQLTVTNRPEGR